MRYRTRHRSAAFTLLEILLALALSAMLIAVVGRVAAQTLEARAYVESEIEILERAARVFTALERDIAFLMPEGLAGVPAVRISGGLRPALQLTVLSGVGTAGGVHLARRPCTVRYRVLSEWQSTRLVREVMDHTVPGSKPELQTLSRAVQRIEITVFAQGQWRDSIDGLGKEVGIAAVRVRCHWPDDTPAAVRTFIIERPST